MSIDSFLIHAVDSRYKAYRASFARDEKKVQSDQEVARVSYRECIVLYIYRLNMAKKGFTSSGGSVTSFLFVV